MIVDDVALGWLGYTGITRDRKHIFRKMLDAAQIPYAVVDINDVKTSWPEVANKIIENANKNTHSMKWCVMSGLNFKLACMHVQTPTARKTATFFLELEQKSIMCQYV